MEATEELVLFLVVPLKNKAKDDHYPDIWINGRLFAVPARPWIVISLR
jgi:hypothetical protein